MLSIIKWVYKQLMPNWAKSRHPDASHFYQRRFTASYQRKKEKVKSIWMVMGCIMLMCPLIQFVVPILLFTSFVAFCILDET